MAISPSRTDRRRLAACVLAAGLALAAGTAHAARSYWLNSGQNVITCAGNSRGETLKAGVTSRTASLLINGFILCKDEGDAYRYEVSFLNVAINPGQRGSLDREDYAFDWLGLALYKPAPEGEERIEWLFDEARPIAGRLQRSDTRKLVFGNLSFRVPKAAADRATNMTFYITAEGLLYNFRLL